MKNLLFILVIAWAGLCMNSYAQMVPGTMTSLQLGSQNFVKNNMMPNQIVGSDGNGFYLTKVKLKHEIREGSNFPVLEHYDNQMRLTRYRELKVDNTETTVKFERIIELGDQLFCFYSSLDKGIKSKTLWAQKINKSTLSLEDRVIPVQSIDYAGMPSYLSPDFHFKLSPNRKILLVSSQKTHSKITDEGFLFSAFDENLSGLWAKEISSPFEKGLFSIENYHITNKGKAYLLAKTVKRAKDLEIFWEPNYSFEILDITQDEKEKFLIQPEVKDKFLSKMQISTKPNGDLICAGFYLDQLNKDVSGSYFISLANETGKITHSDFKAFNPKSNTHEKGKTYSSQNIAKSISSYSLNDIILRKDGSAVIIAEQATITSGNNPRNNLPGQQINFNNIAVISVAPEGRVIWTQEIQKNQLSTAGYSFFSSFATMVTQDKIYFVFNDHPENLCEGICTSVEFSPRSPKKDVLIALVELDWNGNIKKRALSFSRDLNILTKPEACQQVSSNEMVILGQNNKSYQMAKLEFEKTFAYQ